MAIMSYAERWPRELLRPTDADELVCGMLAVHEAAHAVVGSVLGLSPAAIRVHPDAVPDGAVRGTQFAADPSGTTGAVVALAARPAVQAYLRAVGQDSPDTLARAESQFAADVHDAARHAPGGLTALREQAAAAVDRHWTAITGLAGRICAAAGTLQAPPGGTLLDPAAVPGPPGSAAAGFRLGG